MEAREEVRKALHSLPWYLIGGWLFLPLILAVFTGGASLLLYLLPFGMFNDGEFWVSFIALTGPGFAVWIPRQFFRAAIFAWRRNHRQIIHY